jgi:hypothetical protein
MTTNEPLIYSFYKAKATQRDFADMFFPADAEDALAQMLRSQELCEAFDASEHVMKEIAQELARLQAAASSRKGRRREEQALRYEQAVAQAYADVEGEGYHRTAEFYRRLMVLRNL